MPSALSRLFSPTARRASRVVVNGDDLIDDPELPAAVAEVRRGRLEPGRRLLAAASGDFELRRVRLRKLAAAAVPRIGELRTLYANNPDDGDIALWLGSTTIEHAWEVRGSAYAKYTDRRRFEEFWLILGHAYEPLMRAVELCPDDPVPWDCLQWYGLGIQRPRSDLDDIWAELKRRDPGFFEGHATRIQVLCAKWQGSNEEVRAFALEAASGASPGSPIPALLVAAEIEVALELNVSAVDRFRVKAIQTRLAEFADAWQANPDGNIRTAEAHHLFGAAFYLSGDWLRARRHLSRVSPRSIPRTLPWVRLSLDPAALYLQARAEVGITDDTVFDPGPLPLIPPLPRRPAAF